ncbi:MAG: hypothetical protein ACFE95_00170 [Candidatus Hodarchaeota archaeon]
MKSKVVLAVIFFVILGTLALGSSPTVQASRNYNGPIHSGHFGIIRPWWPYVEVPSGDWLYWYLAYSVWITSPNPNDPGYIEDFPYRALIEHLHDNHITSLAIDEDLVELETTPISSPGQWWRIYWIPEGYPPPDGYVPDEWWYILPGDPSYPPGAYWWPIWYIEIGYLSHPLSVGAHLFASYMDCPDFVYDGEILWTWGDFPHYWDSYVNVLPRSQAK